MLLLTSKVILVLQLMCALNVSACNIKRCQMFHLLMVVPSGKKWYQRQNVCMIQVRF